MIECPETMGAFDLPCPRNWRFFLAAVLLMGQAFPLAAERSIDSLLEEYFPPEDAVWEDNDCRGEEKKDDIPFSTMANFLARNPSGHELAMRCYDASIRLHPDAAGTIANRGWLFFKLGQKDAALADADRALQLDGGLAPAHLLRGNIMLERGRYGEAADHYGRVVKDDPRRSDLLPLLAECYYQADRYDECARTLEPLEGKPGAPKKLHALLADCLNRNAAPQKALEAAGRGLSLDPKDADLAEGRAAALLRLGRWKDAVKACDEALAIDPGRRGCHLKRALAKEKLGRLAESMADFDLLVKSSSATAYDWFARCAAWDNRKAWGKAVADCTRSVELDRSDGNVFVVRGRAYQRLGDLDRALADFQNAVLLMPSSLEAFMKLGIVRAQRGEHELALAAFNRLLELKPDGSLFLLLRALPLGRLKRFEEAVADLDKAAAMGKAARLVPPERVLVLHAMGKKDEAVKLARSVTGGEPWECTEERYLNMLGFTRDELALLRKLGMCQAGGAKKTPAGPAQGPAGPARK